MKKQKFLKQCAKLSRTTAKDIKASHTIVRCDCGESDCPGWRAVYLFRNALRRKERNRMQVVDR